MTILGLQMGAKWGLPDTLLQCMAMPSDKVPTRSLAGRPERMTWLASLANDGAETILNTEPVELGTELGVLTERYARALDLTPQALQDAAGRARKRMTEMTDALNMTVPARSSAERLLDTYYVDAPNAGETGPDPEDLGLDSQNGVLSQIVPLLDEQSPADVLAAGVQDITNTLVDQFKLNDVLQMILETMLRALDCRRVIFCLKDAKSGALVGRIGMGDGADAIKAMFKVPVDRVDPAKADLFGAVCLKNLDTLIADASTASVSARLPGWFRDQVQSPTFLLLPMVVKRANQQVVLGLIYADKARAGTLKVDERELSLLRTLRNQAIMAFKQGIMRAMFRIVLVEPEIPPNTGNVIRLAANTGCELHLIEPLGFSMDDKLLRRAGLDYHEYAPVRRHASWQAFLDAMQPDHSRMFAFTTRGSRPFGEVAWQSGDWFVFGCETRARTGFARWPSRCATRAPADAPGAAQPELEQCGGRGRVRSLAPKRLRGQRLSWPALQQTLRCLGLGLRPIKAPTACAGLSGRPARPPPLR
jgi:tRNA (cytidine(34)-2'-O)-methyltransferase